MFFFCLLPVGVCIVADMKIFCSYVLCVHSLITHLQLKKMSVMYESAHNAITFYFLEMSSITTPNQKQFSNIRTRYIFQSFFRENVCDFTELHTWKKSVWKLRVNGII